MVHSSRILTLPEDAERVEPLPQCDAICRRCVVCVRCEWIMLGYRAPADLHTKVKGGCRERLADIARRMNNVLDL